MERVSFLSESYRRVSCTTLPPPSMISIWRATSYWIAFSTKRNELRFLISARVPNFAAPSRPHRHVGVAAERAFLHVAVADLEVAHQRVDLLHVRDRFLGRAHVRLGDDLEQRRAGAVQVDAAGVREALVQRLAGILLEVRARDADGLDGAVLEHDVERAARDDRLLVLADLVALRQVRIEVVLAREDRARARSRAPIAEPELDRHAHRLGVQHRQHARVGQIDQARLRVRRARRTRSPTPENIFDASRAAHGSRAR